MVEKSGSLSAAQENSVKLSLGSQAFVKILIHSKQCGSCDNLKCKKMKMIHDHFNKCSRNGQNCPVCGQFIALVRPFVKWEKEKKIKATIEDEDVNGNN